MGVFFCHTKIFRKPTPQRFRSGAGTGRDMAEVLHWASGGIFMLQDLRLDDGGHLAREGDGTQHCADLQRSKAHSTAQSLWESHGENIYSAERVNADRGVCRSKTPPPYRPRHSARSDHACAHLGASEANGPRCWRWCWWRRRRACSCWETQASP